MNNLDRIKLAEKIGYYAVIVFQEWNEAHTVVTVSDESLVVYLRTADNQVFKRTYKELGKSNFHIF